MIAALLLATALTFAPMPPDRGMAHTWGHGVVVSSGCADFARAFKTKDARSMVDDFKFPEPTDECSELVRIIGPEQAFNLIENLSGRRVYVPTGLWPLQETKLAKLIGEDATKRLAEEMGGTYLKVPIARNWRILIYRARGLSYGDICQSAGCSPSTVQRILNIYGKTNQTGNDD